MKPYIYKLLGVALAGIFTLQTGNASMANLTIEDISIGAFANNGGYPASGGNSGYVDRSYSLNDSLEYSYSGWLASSAVSLSWAIDPSNPEEETISFSGSNWVSDTYRLENQSNPPGTYNYANFGISFDLAEPTWIRIEYAITGYPSFPAGTYGQSASIGINIAGHFFLNNGATPDGVGEWNGAPAPSGSVFLLEAGHHSISSRFMLSSDDAGSESGDFNVKVSMGSAVPEPSTWLLIMSGAFVVAIRFIRQRRKVCAGVIGTRDIAAKGVSAFLIAAALLSTPSMAFSQQFITRIGFDGDLPSQPIEENISTGQSSVSGAVGSTTTASGSAYSTPGFMSVTGGATKWYNPIQPSSAAGVSSFASMDDWIDLGGLIGSEGGRLGVTFTLNREVSASAPEVFSYMEGSSRMRLMIVGNSGVVAWDSTWDYAVTGTINGGNPETRITDTIPFAFDTPHTAWINFGAYTPSAQLFAVMELHTEGRTNGGSNASSPAVSFASYSFEILGLTLQTTSGQNIEGASLTSASGFDYNAVPEPSTYAMLVVGGAALGLGLLRRRTVQ